MNFRLKPLSLTKAGNQIGNTVFKQWKHFTVFSGIIALVILKIDLMVCCLIGMPGCVILC